MAALDDRYDVLDYARKHGIADMEEARQRMYAEYWAKHPDTRSEAELEAIRERNRKGQAAFREAFKARYGAKP